MNLRKAGASYQQIADHLGITAKTAHNAVTRALEKLRVECAEDAVAVREMELDRLDTMLMGLWERSRNGDGPAIDRTLRIMERRSKLLGIDAPTKGEITGKDGEPLTSKIEIIVVGRDDNKTS